MSGILKVDQILKRDGSTPSASDLGLNVSGSIIQVVSKTDYTNTGTTATSFVASGVFIDITPKYTNSKIYVSFSGTSYTTGNGYYSIGRNGVVQSSECYRQIGAPGSTRYVPSEIGFTDSPNTTSLVRYELYYMAGSGYQIYWPPGSNDTTNIIAMEIAQ